jgi:hypothetical protein
MSRLDLRRRIAITVPGKAPLSGSVGEPPRFLCVVCIAALALFAFPSGAAPLISPAAGSDGVLAMRSDTQGELRLQYRVERENQPDLKPEFSPER